MGNLKAGNNDGVFAKRESGVAADASTRSSFGECVYVSKEAGRRSRFCSDSNHLNKLLTSEAISLLAAVPK
jgi:hypothetical protein